jgi:hypothetical protein
MEVERMRRERGRRARWHWPIGSADAIDALAMRRTATDVPELLRSKLTVIASQASALDVTLRIEAAIDVPAFVHVDSEKVAWAVTWPRATSRESPRPRLDECGRLRVYSR